MELVKSISIANLVNQRNAFVERVNAARASIGEAREILRASGFDRGGRHPEMYEIELESISGFRHAVQNDKVFDMLISGYDAKAWDHLMHESGMLSFMSAKDVEDWGQKIQKREIPALTMDSIKATFSELHAKRKQMMNDGIEQLYRALSWSHKTNSPVAFGKKIILQGRNDWPCNRNRAHVDDVIRFMHVMDGKPQPDHRDNFSMFSDFQPSSAFQSDYVSVVGFQNGNLHVYFKRPDLVAKMNAVLASRYPAAIPKPKAA
ncbi:DUF4942 domain-containing protein [Massilia sp. NP310]|uniref:DUF4942 domain-containing protein n=1 Tax=Massilia sp. NP310 TaxID=2861282 RepID=UPI001C62C145|nr:DUF4942 domain-containing protein [Massilia sp. NP310]QYG04038.1 DUF4942 domain-containing protein [Massilia sp. NP310]